MSDDTTTKIIGRRPGPGEDHGTPAHSLFLGHSPYPDPVKKPVQPHELTEPGTKRRLVHCPRAASQLGHLEMRVYVLASDARKQFYIGSNWTCRDTCGFRCAG